MRVSALTDSISPTDGRTAPPLQRGRKQPYLVAIGLTALMIGISSYGLVLFGTMAEANLVEEFRTHLKDAAAIAALQIDGDAHQHLATLPNMTIAVEDLAFLPMLEALRGIKDTNAEYLYVYTYIPSNVSGEVLVMMDANIDPQKPGELLSPYDATDYPEMRRGLKQVTADHVIDCDADDACFSGYAPIRNSAGSIVAALGIDTDAKGVRAHLGSVAVALQRSLVVSILLLLAVGATMSTYVHLMVVSRRAQVQAEEQLRRSYEEVLTISQALTEQAELVKRGSFGQVALPEHSDIPQIHQLLLSFRFLLTTVRVLVTEDESAPPK